MKEKKIIQLFDILKETTTRVSHIFEQIDYLRKAINSKSMIIEETRKLELLFHKLDFQLISDNPKVTKKIDEKISKLFNSPNLQIGRMQSKGTYNFFESVYRNPNYYGDIESGLSKLRKECEVSWYGILQAYGKLILDLQEEN